MKKFKHTNEELERARREAESPGAGKDGGRAGGKKYGGVIEF